VEGARESRGGGVPEKGEEEEDDEEDDDLQKTLNDPLSNDNDAELLRILKLYGSSFRKSELTDLRREFLSIGKDSETIPVAALKKILIDLSFMNESKIDEDDHIGDCLKRLASTTPMTIFINRARDIKPCDSNGLSDPFCQILVDYKVVADTAVQEKTLNPVFEENITINIHKGTKKISIALYDSDMGSKEYQGSVDLDILAIRQGKAAKESWHKIKFDNHLCRLAQSCVPELSRHC
jgi:hypothetical protein